MNLFKHYQFNIGLCAIILIVLLRIAIGWHFFYEGLHKFDPAHEFSAQGFLGVAKGPIAPLYYQMLPDIQGLGRLVVGTIKDSNNGRDVKTFLVYEKAWNDYYARFVKEHSLNDPAKAEQKKQVDAVFLRYLKSLRDGAVDVESDVSEFKQSLQRFQETKRDLQNDAKFEQIRRWDAMMAYRSEANSWILMLNNMSKGLRSDMARIISPQLAGDTGHIITGPEEPLIPNPVVPSHMKMLDMSVMYGLSAIGICMILGFCNRLACLGGAVFLVNVILTTWPVPGVHPPLPSAVGSFLFVSKDAVELIAMLMLASMPAGRWGGLDYFLWYGGGKKIAKKYGLVTEALAE